MAPNDGSDFHCAKCNKKLNKNAKFLICELGCKMKFCAYDTCMSSKKFDGYVGSGEKWKCPDCVKKNVNNDDDEIEINLDNPSGSDKNTDKFDKLLEKMDILNRFQSEMNEKLSNIEKENLTLKNELESLKNNYVKCEGDFEMVKQENNKLLSQIADLKCDSNDLKQHAIKDNIEIAGVPVVKDENLANVFEKIAQQMNVSIGKQHILQIYRIKGRRQQNGMPPVIIVRVPENLKEKFTRNKKRYDLKTNQLGFPDADTRNIYINDQLIKENKYLLKRAKDIRRADKIKFAWTRYGKIFIKKEENGRTVRIRKLEDLDAYNQ
jgi:hypothetical protein